MTLTEFLSQCKEKSEKATPGPVVIERRDSINGSIDYIVHEVDDFATCRGSANPNNKLNAEFIAFSRNNFMKLVRIVELYRKELQWVAFGGPDGVDNPANMFVKMEDRARAILAEAERIAGE